jgi:spore maturation protein CgeB
VADAAVLRIYEAEGIHAAYFPVAFEPSHNPLPDVPAYDVLYLGNNYSDYRRGLYDVLRSLPAKVGIYGNGWPQNEGECTYDFTTGHALYQRAKIAIADNQYADAVGSLSTRTLQAFGAGCFTLHQKVADLKKLTGFIPGRHYVSFETLDQLPDLVAYWLAPERDLRRQVMGDMAREFVLEKHTWAVRVRRLVEELLPEVARV